MIRTRAHSQSIAPYQWLQEQNKIARRIVIIPTPNRPARSLTSVKVQSCINENTSVTNTNTTTDKHLDSDDSKKISLSRKQESLEQLNIDDNQSVHADHNKEEDDEDNLFDRFIYPDPPKPLSCGGLPCARCNKCTTWKFTGDKATWNWIKKANQNNWPQKDIDRWRRDRIYNFFENHGNCYVYVYYGVGVDVDDVYYDYVVGVVFHICLCD
ncbi:unnamed protein product [Rotaria socialis]